MIKTTVRAIALESRLIHLKIPTPDGWWESEASDEDHEEAETLISNFAYDFWMFVAKMDTLKDFAETMAFKSLQTEMKILMLALIKAGAHKGSVNNTP